MKEATEYFERILWFIYRVIFTLLPSVVLSFITFLFFNSFFPEKLLVLEKSFSSFGLEKWIVLLVIIFCLNLILESLTNFFVYRLVNFRKLSQERYSKDESLKTLLQTYNPTIFGILTKNYGEIALEATLLNYGVMYGESKSALFTNYLWFLISREFLFCNLSIAVIICYLFYASYYMHIQFTLDFQTYIWLQIIQIIIICILFFYTRLLLKLNYPEHRGTNETKGYDDSRSNIYMITIPIVIIILSLFISTYLESKFIITEIILQSLLFILCPLLFLRALREYIHVEYLIMTSFAKGNIKEEPDVSTTKRL